MAEQSPSLARNLDQEKATFEGVSYFLNPALGHKRCTELGQSLRENGAIEAPRPLPTSHGRRPLNPTDDNESSQNQSTDGEDANQPVLRFDPERTTHIITADMDFSESEVATQAGIALVTPLWVERALRNGVTHSPEFYSPDPIKIFSGVVVATSGLPKVDREKLFGGVSALGGQYRADLQYDVTHLACLVAEGAKYQKVMEVPELGIKAVLPHWFDDCFKLRRIVSEDMYLFPDPPLLRLDLWADSVSTVTTAATSTHTINTLSLPSPSQPQPAAAGTSSSRRPLPLANASSALANTTSTMGSFVPQPKEPWIFPGPSNATPIPEPSSKFLMGFRFYLCEDLHVNKNLRTTFEERLTQAGATVVAQGRPYRSSGVDCFVGKYREGDGYIQACRDGKVVGSLFWLQHIFNTQRMESPKNLLLNYPQPKEKLPEFENFVITVSNYTGVTRDYVKRLIYILGASYTPHMTPANTHVICAAPTGDKFTKALEWNTHVVNHLWLEECYQQWTCKSIADERYTYFPEGAKMEDLVGRTPVLSFEVEKWWKPGEDEEEEQEKMTGAEIQDDGEGGDESRSESVSNIVTSVTDTDKDTTTPSRTKHKPLGTGSVTTVSKQPRQAAVNASSMLHEVIMPDVVAFQKEMRTPTRRGVKSSSAGAGSTNSGSGDSVGKRRRHKSREGEDEVESIKRKSNKRSRKESEVSDEGTMAEEGEEEQEEDLEERQGQIASTEVTPTRAKGRSKAMLDRSRSSSVTESANEKVKERRSHDTSADTTPTKGLPGGGVRVLTTGYRLSAQEIKGLKSLGVRMATTPRDCTHLIADRVARTEKFLSCVSIAQHILSLGWVTTSIEQGHLVDEKPYMLKDTKAEKQYKFRLAKSLEKAKQGKLLAGKEVYITQNTQPAKETMKEIVECAGGKLVNAVSVRKIRDGAASGSLLIISCDEDRDRWDEFRAYGLDVHSPELLLTGVLRQELNVNGKEFKLVG